jgi:hypothetical protein
MVFLRDHPEKSSDISLVDNPNIVDSLNEISLWEILKCGV